MVKGVPRVGVLYTFPICSSEAMDSSSNVLIERGRKNYRSDPGRFVLDSDLSIDAFTRTCAELLRPDNVVDILVLESKPMELDSE